MDLSRESPRLVVVVGSGGVGKTTLAAALGVASAEAGVPTLVMTFDPAQRLKDTLGIGAAGGDLEVPVALPRAGSGSLAASLLDARATFDRLVSRYAPDAASRDRILRNRFYDELAGNLAGVLEYMAVERLFEVAAAGRYRRVVLDTPPTRQALDFLEAPRRIVGFLDSGALRIALKPWFDEEGRLRPARRFGALGRRAERFLDGIVGLGLLRDMAEFFQAFGPLYDGFRQRAHEVEGLLRAPETEFLLVAGPAEERVPDTLFFARRLVEAGMRLRAVVVNRLHPAPEAPLADTGVEPGDGRELVRWQGDRDRRGVERLRALLADLALVEVPALLAPPQTAAELGALGARLAADLRDREGAAR